MSPRKTFTAAVRARLLGTPRAVENPKRPKVRLSVSQAEDRNAPNSLYSPLDLLPPADAPALVAAAEVTESAITVAGADDPAPPPAVPPLAAPPAEVGAALGGVAVGESASAPAGDPLVADILWDPGTTTAAITLGNPVQPAVVAAGPAEETAAALLGDPVTGGSAAEATDTDVTAPAQLLDPDETGGEAGTEGGVGEGYAATSSWSSTGTASGDLDIITSGGAEYDEAKEEDPGGWVAVNNDNDNYNFDKNNALTHIYDKDDVAKVDRENDLVGILVKAATPHPTNPGKFTLEWTSPKIKVYKSADKDLPVGSGVVVAANDKLYVEGQSMSEGMANEKITLGWVDQATKARGVVDTVAFTVYEVRGAMNVPGFSSHTYSIRTPDARVSTIDTVVGGKADPTTVVNPVTFTTSRDILWDGGPVLGKYKATPVAGEPFWSEREVNVVRVELITAGGPNNRLILSNFPSQDPMIRARIVSHTNVAMSADLRATSIDGPTVTADGVMRGVKFIEMGFIQHMKASKINGVYNHLLVPQQLRHELQDGVYWLDTDIEPRSNRPWYNKSNDPAYGVKSYFRASADPVAPIVDVDFSIKDTPRAC